MPPEENAPQPSPQPGKGANENVRFERVTNPFEGVRIPDKFVRDGQPDLAAFVSSYGELETRMNTKTEELKAQIQAELAKDRPEKPDDYKLPQIEGIDPKELGESPLMAWWRETAHGMGFGQERFAEGVAKYMEALAPAEPDMEAVKTALGDSFQARIDAVDAWAAKTAKNDGELAHLKAIAIDADGIKLLERLAGIGGKPMEGGGAAPEPALTLPELRAMQNDPRYWDPTRRDPDFVKRIEAGYEKLYAKRNS